MFYHLPHNRQNPESAEFSGLFAWIERDCGVSSPLSFERSCRREHFGGGLFQLHAVAEGFSDNLAHDAVGVEGRVEDDRAQLAEIDLAVGEDALVGLGGHDLADQVAGRRIPVLHFAFQREGELLDDRGVDVRALVDVAAGLFDLVDLRAGLHAEVIGDEDGVSGAEGDRERARLLEVFRGLVLAEHQGDLAHVALHAPGRVHGVGDAAFVVGADDEYALGRDGGLLSAEFHAVILLDRFAFFARSTRTLSFTLRAHPPPAGPRYTAPAR